MSMQSLIGSSPRGTKAKPEGSAERVWQVGLFTLTVVLLLIAIVSGLDPAHFAVSTDAGALL